MVQLGQSYLSFVQPLTSDMVKRNGRLGRSRRTGRTKRRRAGRTGRTRKVVRPKNSRRRLQGKTNSLRTAIALGSGLQSAYEASKTVFDAINQPTGTATRKRMRNGGSRTVTTRKKDDDGTGPYQQWSQRYAQATFGKMKLSKLINRETLTLTHQSYSRFNQGKGVYFLSQYTDTANNARRLPMVYWDLTSTPNHVNGTISNPNPMYQIYKSTAVATDGNIGWSGIIGKDMGGNPSSTWQVEQTENSSSNAASYPGANSVLQWVSIELELWGQQQFHTKYTIELCQIDDEVTPDPQAALTGTGGQYEMFWDNHMKSYTYSPLYSGAVHGLKGKKMKVWKRYNVDIDPTTTIESNADPHCKTFRMFFRLNRRCTYDWRKAGGNGQTVAEFDAAHQPTEVNTNELTVDPKARVYLIIRATDFNVKNSYAECTVANSPSLSWKIRTKHQLVN